MHALNHIYRLVWSDASESFVAVAETASGRGKTGRAGRARRALQAAVLALATSAADASAAPVLPTDGAVKAGTASISQTGHVVTINQSTAKLVTDWQRFSIGAGGTVNFVQPSSSAVALNRVLGNDVSTIQGALNANGHVFIVNPNGVLFTKTAQVQTGGLVASTLDIANADFLAGRYSFSGSSTASVTNQGHLRAANGASVALVGARIVNSGSITADQGGVLLGAGRRVTLDLGGPVKLSVDEASLNAYIEQGGAVRADGGQVVLSAQAAGELSSSVINHSGITEARSLGTGQGGQIVLSASHVVVNTGTLSVTADGMAAADANTSTSTISANGGQILIETKNLVDAGTLDATSTQGAGGSLHINASGVVQQTSASIWNASGATHGGSLRMQAGASAWLSGHSSAASAQGRGGDLAASATDLTLAGAQLDASGALGGGSIRVGGGWQGRDPDLPNAQRTRVVSSELDVSAAARGHGGTAVVWADGSTTFGGHIQASGGQISGNGGQVEVSGKGLLTFGGTVDAKAPQGRNGTLLLDPKDIEIVGSVSAVSVLNLPDPTPLAGETFGSGADRLVELLNGGVGINRIVVASPNDGVGATSAGAVYVYNSQTGALVSTLVGSTANDQVGNGGITALSNGNYVVRSSNWANGSATNAGAVTWGNGSTGTSGVVSASNSLVGSQTNDLVGNEGITALSNGNYVLSSENWANGSASKAGAVTWGNGSTGTSGAVSVSNSLVGSQANDLIGNRGVTALSNGNYVVRSENWANGSAFEAGAVTWGNGSTGISGVVSASNSLVGSQSNDQVGGDSITALSNGNYVVRSSNWANGSVANAGAVTWGNGNSGTSGVVSASNSLVGSQTNDLVGNATITALSNGNYVVRSSNWANGSATLAGAVTWGNGSTGTSGVVSVSNSLVGSRSNDQVGNGGITALSNGNYVVGSSNWANGSATNAGAVTWGNGSTGTSGVVSASNSLVGSTSNDLVGGDGIATLRNGNYVVRSSEWNNGSALNAGAVTWGNGSTGTSGVVSVGNSLVGNQTGDRVGNRLVHALSNGNYVVRSINWDNGSVLNAGAVTWGNGATGTSGVVSASNSLVGSRASDAVGNGPVTALSNGNYVVRSTNWDNGSVANAGAVTWGNGNSGTSGVVSASNSLVGSQTNDLVGNATITALSNGNYVVRSSNWANGSATLAGAVTWGNGSSGTSGVVSASNSLVGNQSNDQVGNGEVIALSNGDYAVRSSNWANGSATLAGAVTWGNGTTGTSGLVSVSNSLVGSTSNDQVGSDGVTALSNGRVLVRSSSWDQATPAALANAGRVDILSGGTSAFTSPQTYATNPGASSAFVASDILALLSAGTNVVLQANNDITLSAALTANNPSGNGGSLTLQAGRSLLLNSSITSDNGNITLIANDTAANGVVSAERDIGAAAITMANGTSLDAGTGTVSISLRNGAGNAYTTAGAITLGSISAGSLTVDASSFSGSFTTNNKVYDGAVAATVGASSLSGLAFTASSNLSLLAISASFADANAGAAKTVTADPITLRGFNGSATVGLTLNGTAWQPTSTANITPRPITVTADAQTKVYGNADPSLTYSITEGNLVGSDTLSGALTRAAGENVGNYVINASALANGNYLITANNGNLTIGQRPITVAADAQTKVYGNADPSLTYSITEGNLVGSDTLSGALTRAAGENVGNYVINASALANGNYLITANNGNLTIGQRPITVTADAQTKVYGNADPSLTYSITEGNLVGSDTLSGALTRAAGENVGNYVINASALANGNYLITANNGNLTIGPAAATVKADNGRSTYNGRVQGVSGFSATGLVNGDTASTLSGVSVSGGGTNAGTYTTIASGSSANYTLTFVNGSFVINPANVAIAGLGVAPKTYDGSNSANIDTSQVRFTGLLVGDTLTVANATATFANKNVGSNKVASISGIALGGSSADNYTLSNTTVAATGEIRRLESVAWVGSATGNWFDPANWANGAVPDLANVGSVVIPDNVTIAFAIAGAVAPANASQRVAVDNINGSGGSLRLSDGQLNVANRVQLGSYAQTGGTMNVGGTFNASQSFQQSGGVLNVQGAAAITQALGNALLGRVQVGTTLKVQAQGDIAQSAGSAITAGGGATLVATNGDVSVTNAGNRFGGATSASGRNVGVRSEAALTLGTVTASGNLSVQAQGDITQTVAGAVTVSGSARLASTDGRVTVTNSANRFSSPSTIVQADGTFTASVLEASIANAQDLTARAGNASAGKPGPGNAATGEQGQANKRRGASPLNRLRVVDGGIRLPQPGVAVVAFPAGAGL